MIDAVFLPGIIAPAAVRYPALVAALPEVNARLHDLAVYDGDEPPPGFGIELEVAALRAHLDREGLDRVHIYAHSGGAACALAFTVAHPERVASLAIDEPATDFTAGDRADPYWELIDQARSLADFMRLQVADDVELPAAPPGPPPPWMARRPRAIAAFATALRAYPTISDVTYRGLAMPVLFTLGSRTHPRWFAMRDRLAKLVPNFRAVVFDGLHHLNTSHQAEPARTAALLHGLWS